MSLTRGEQSHCLDDSISWRAPRAEDRYARPQGGQDLRNEPQSGPYVGLAVEARMLFQTGGARRLRHLGFVQPPAARVGDERRELVETLDRELDDRR
jgi:hypothetical protein